jgi:hypothetical protein
MSENLLKQARELLNEASNQVEPNLALRIVEWLGESVLTEPCGGCNGSGREVWTVSDPDNCGNCAYGDCDYGHERSEKCDYCEGSGVVKINR